ncbi:MAG: hypothetical protein M3N46_09430 [Actinomycetota bacterium]|nr:hypothetical protein [Actinomycetota bacterium]
MTTRPRISTLVPVALLALVGSALAGCSATGSTHTGPSRSSSAVVGTPPAASSSNVDGICRYVSVDSANAATHLAFTEQQSGTFVNGEPECGFTNADHSIILNVTVFDLATTPFDLKQAAVGQDALFPVSAVGDRAGVGSVELDAIVGQKGLVVENVSDAGSVTPAQLVALAQLFVPHIR